MEKVVQKVREFVEAHGMFQGARRAVLAVSGGPDSIALLDIIVQLFAGGESEKGPRSTPKTSRSDRTIIQAQDDSSGPPSLSGPHPRTILDLWVGHLDHLLRPQSAEDARFVANTASRYGLPAQIGSADVRGQAGSSGRGVEETAREARYRFLLELARTVGADRIVTGHNMDDQAETILLRLIRGTGAVGLSGIRPIRPAHEFEGPGRGTREAGTEAAGSTVDGVRGPVLLVRPLLCLTKAEIEEYCRARSLEFRVDPSNESLEFTRNQIRHSVMPTLSALNPKASEAIARAADILRSEAEICDAAAANALDRARVARSPLEMLPTGPCYEIREFLEQPSPIRIRMIKQALGRLAAGVEFGSTHFAAVDGLITQGESGLRIDLPQNVEVWREFGLLKFTVAAVGSSYHLHFGPGQEAVRIQGLTLTIERELPSELLPELMNEASALKASLGVDWTMAVLDDQKLPKEMIVRPRTSGEKATVLGHRGLKKLKNLMIGHRIPASSRSTWPVVVSAEGCYIWSPGLPPSSDLSAKDNARALAVLRASAGAN